MTIPDYHLSAEEEEAAKAMDPPSSSPGELTSPARFGVALDTPQ